MSSAKGFKKKDMDRAIGQVKAGKTVKSASKACNVPQTALQEHVQKARATSTTKKGAAAASTEKTTGPTRQIDVYLTMLYVTLEQETALKKFFTSKGWRYTKPDLSVTTEKVGPASPVNPSSPTTEKVGPASHVNPGSPTKHGGTKTKSAEVQKVPPSEVKKSPIKTASHVSTPAHTRASPRLQSRPRRAFNKYGEDFEIKAPSVAEVKVEVESDVEESEDEDLDEDIDEDEADMDDDFADDLSEYYDSEDDDDNGGLDGSQMEGDGGEAREDCGKAPGGKKRAAGESGAGSPGASAGNSQKKQKTAATSTPGSEREEEEGDAEEILEMTDSMPIGSSSRNGLEGSRGDLQPLQKQSPSTVTEETVQCSICHHKFKGTHSLSLHILQKHSKKRTMPKLVKYEGDESFQNEEGFKTNECSKCKAEFSTKRSLLNHYKSKHDIEFAKEKILGCKLCEEKFRFKKDLFQHMKQEHGVLPKPKLHICDICGVVCKRSDNLLEHLRHVHQGLPRRNKFSERKHTCEVCGTCFFRKAHLKEHLLVKHSNNPLPHTCPECGQGFIRPKILESHMNKVHLNVKPYSCPHCKKSFFSNGSMNAHVASGVCPHIGKREFPCSECSKAFCTSRNLDMHVIAMHGGGAFTCVCGDVVRWASSVAKHKRRCKVFQEKYGVQGIEGFKEVQLESGQGSTTIVIIGGEDAETIELSDRHYQEMERIGAIQPAQTEYADVKAESGQQVQHVEIESIREVCLQYDGKDKTPRQTKTGTERATKMVLVDTKGKVNNNEPIVKTVIAEKVTGKSADIQHVRDISKKSTETDVGSQTDSDKVVVQHVVTTSSSSAFNSATSGDGASTSQETVDSGGFAVEDMSDLVHIVQEQVTVGGQEETSQYDIPVMQEIYVVTMPE